MPKLKPSETADNARHPLWRKQVTPTAEAQADWYETLRGEAISRLRHKEVAAAEAVMELQYRSLPNDDMRSYLRQWAIALRDNVTWDPVWPPLPEHFDGQPDASPVVPNKPTKTGKPSPQAGVKKSPDGFCDACSKPVFKMHLARHTAKYHG